MKSKKQLETELEDLFQIMVKNFLRGHVDEQFERCCVLIDFLKDRGEVYSSYKSTEDAVELICGPHMSVSSKKDVKN